ncbi:MAG: hypothetical protein WAQ93_06010, partial [Chitinophagaceae bacterium]
VMDIMALQKKSILVPTPGQTEQEYLGNFLMEKGLSVCVEQKEFSLAKAMSAAFDFDYKIQAATNDTLLTKNIQRFLSQSFTPAFG